MQLDPRKNKNLRITLILVVAAVAAYFVYRWWVNRQPTSDTSGGITLGTNLNSTMPDLSAGATGPESGIETPGTQETVNITIPGTGATTPPEPQPKQKGKIIRGGVNTGHKVLTPKPPVKPHVPPIRVPPIKKPVKR